MELTRTGRCYCGAVTYKIKGNWEGITNCHCKDCQQFHGNYNPMLIGSPEDVAFTEDKGLEWYASSPGGERGFCNVCGSALFKRHTDGSKFELSVGNLDDTSGLTTKENIWLEEKGTYYVVPPISAE